MDNQILITNSFEQLRGIVAKHREQKGKDSQTLDFVDGILHRTHDLILELILEKHLVYQHMVMEEDAKPFSKRNKKRRDLGLKGMKQAALEAQKWMIQNRLKNWESRVNRCLGRVADYNKDYKKAILCYKKAIATSKKDPEWTDLKVPRWLELEAFLAYSTLMQGNLAKGILLSKQVYKKFVTSKEALYLRKVDYPTWAIWTTGIPIRTTKALIEKKAKFDKKEVLDWLGEASKLIEKPVGGNKWVGKIDFGFRKDEISSLKRQLI